MVDPSDLDRAPQHQRRQWSDRDIGASAPCERCGQQGVVQRAWPSLGAESPIVARCIEHTPEDDYT